MTMLNKITPIWTSLNKFEKINLPSDVRPAAAAEAAAASSYNLVELCSILAWAAAEATVEPAPTGGETLADSLSPFVWGS